MNEEQTPTPEDLAAGLARIRSRRNFLWGTILVYLPAMWGAILLFRSDAASGGVFAGWLLLVCTAAARAMTAPCPRCDGYYFRNGFAPLFTRKCAHCALPLNGEVER